MARGQLKFNRRRIRGFTGNELKIIAVLCMLCDHIGYMLIENSMLYGYNPEYWNMAIATPEGERLYILARILRMIGRLSFPIFAYMLTEGFIHTKNLRKYMGRVLILALVSEIPFDLAVFHKAFEFSYQNVCFTLYLGLCAMYFMKRWKKKFILPYLAVAAMAALSYLIRSDYSIVGVLLIAVFYALRRDRSAGLFVGAVISAVESFHYYCTALLAFIPLRFYNGKRGSAGLKYFFYIFYPLHLLIFFAIVYFGNR